MKKLICKLKGHDFIIHHEESNGFGDFWKWKQCKRCNCSTYDIEPIKIN